MSIYFQYPAINDYPNLAHPIKIGEADRKKTEGEDKLNQDEVIELKDFLALKPV
ncbi:hypothetical protein [Pedobacter rhodius]|uniref:Uncharacterized protein n=1 Tax=Pedobacter rhodius TaxID=3004098 RepID=A0ABT4KV55_9SPHI|nr:hypothetical protein [Pedobacter sp. SJ11]MCZ4222798.1 hypothetical protein [Pedobacter sp. SJ11]